MSPEFDQQGQVIQGNQINIGVMHGDIVYRRIELQAPLREAFDFLIEERRANFGGRKQELAQINDFLRQEAGGYLVITAGAGFGKTSLMAELAGGQGDAFAYHFFTPLYDRSLSEETFLRSVVQQMAAWHGEEGELHAETDQLTALYHKYLDQNLDEARILLLDGLDEVTRWSLAPYLQRRLPPNLHIMVTIRDVGQEWQQEYGFPAGQLTHLPLGGLTTADIQEILLAAGGQAVNLADDKKVVAEIGRVAAYDEDQPELGADPFYVAFLAEDLAQGSTTAQDLALRPNGLDAYLDGWWKGIREQAGDQATRDHFGTLAAARGRLSRSDLEALNPSLVDDWAGDYFDEVLAGVRRMVIGDEKSGYTLLHPRLQIYLRDPLRIKAIPAYAAKLLAFCLDWQANHSAYASRLLGEFDKWGTRMRVHNARAAELFYAGSKAEADETLAWVASQAHGYAGFATIHLLAVANRWLEFGQPQRIEQPLFEFDDNTLENILDDWVANVRDADFRESLTDLVRQYKGWRDLPVVPDTETGLDGLRRLQDEHARSIYVDYMSALWSWPSEDPNLHGLKALLSLVLDSESETDLVLARMLRAYLTTNPRALDGPALAEAQEVVNESLTGGRRWELAYGPQMG